MLDNLYISIIQEQTIGSLDIDIVSTLKLKRRWARDGPKGIEQAIIFQPERDHVDENSKGPGGSKVDVDDVSCWTHLSMSGNEVRERLL